MARARPVSRVSLPLRFEENRGQFDRHARYVAQQAGLTLFATDQGAILSLRRGSTTATLTLKVHDGRQVAPVARQPLATRSNYFIGHDPAKWHTNVSNFSEVAYRGVRPGVDLVYHGASTGQVEYDFIVAPGASPDVALDVEGADRLRIAADGALEIPLGDAILRQLPPHVYQLVDGRQRTLVGHYRLTSASTVAIAVVDYDRTRPLVIDPVLVYSTYLGGAGDEGPGSLSVDNTGAIYVSGTTTSANFPVANAKQPSYAGQQDLFIAKLTPAGDGLIYATYIGGAMEESGGNIAVDATGAVYLVGATASTDFPLANAFQPTYGEETDGVIVKLAPTGDALVYSTYFGGHAEDELDSVAVDASGAAYVLGNTHSTDLPLANAFQSSLNNMNGSMNGYADDFVVKFDPSGASLVYSTYLGGSGAEEPGGVVIDASGAAYVTGATASTDFPTVTPVQSTFHGGSYDGFIAKLSPMGNSLVYSTYLGGNDDDYIGSPAVDVSGAVYLVGSTMSFDFPLVHALQSKKTGPAVDGIIAKLTAEGTALVYSTYFGSSGGDQLGRVRVDGSGTAFIVGVSNSPDLPMVNAAQPTLAGDFDGVVLALSPDGSAIVWSTYFGGSAQDSIFDLALGPGGIVTVLGETVSKDLPVKQPLQLQSGGGADSFVARFAIPLTIVPSAATVAPNGTLSFSATSGTGPYVWSLATNQSGATIDASTGFYSAGAIEGADVVHVVDSIGNTAEATVTVTAAGPSFGDLGTPEDLGAVGDSAHPPRGCGCRIGGSAGARSGGVGLALIVGLFVAQLIRRRSSADQRN